MATKIDISVTLDPAMVSKIDAIAKEEGRSRMGQLRFILQQWLNTSESRSNVGFAPQKSPTDDQKRTDYNKQFKNPEGNGIWDHVDEPVFDRYSKS